MAKKSKVFFHEKTLNLNAFLFNFVFRQDQPGKFCAITSTFFFTVAMIGSSITTLGLFYYVSVGYLTIPGVLKLLVKYPAVQCKFEKSNSCTVWKTEKFSLTKKYFIKSTL